MTARDHARIAERRIGEGRHEFEPEPAPRLGELLLAARERKGVNLDEAERDTRIRASYLDALERGDFGELPGAVYTKGFLRNYAVYLGLDPEAVLARWNTEAGSIPRPRQPVVVRPRRVVVPRPTRSITPGFVVAAVLTMAVLAFAGYIALQLLRFTVQTTLTVDQPPITELAPGTETFRLSGSSLPNATITITTRAGIVRLAANDQGAWARDVAVAEGRNDFGIVATDPESGKESQPVRLIVQVATAAGPEAPTLTITSPNDGAAFTNGAIPIEGTTNARRITVSAEVGHASASPDPSSQRPPPPWEPATPPDARDIAVADDGAFSDAYQLAPGAWTLTITATGAQGKTTTVTREITVAFTGVNLVIDVRDGRAWIKVWVDGEVAPDAPGIIVQPGGSLEFTGQQTIEVRTGSSGSTFFTLNGTALGSLGPVGAPQTWLFDPPNPPQQTGRTN